MNVLVLGASRGIGLELVRQYLRAGAQAFPLDVAQADRVSGLSRLLNDEKLDMAHMRRSLAELKRPARVLSAQDVPYVQWLAHCSHPGSACMLPILF